ncbi:hypothetical protein PMAYCL1PPCAC_27938, partial [Pristionchus mayeri]
YMILLIHFLQRLKPHPLLPVLQEMGDMKEILVDGWDVYFCDKAPKLNWSQCNLSVGELFMQFLEYYLNFDWDNQVVQIRQTNVLTKHEKCWDKPMCIEDPFELERNLGYRINRPMFTFIMTAFEVSHLLVFSSLKEGCIFNRVSGEERDDVIGEHGNSLLTKCRNLAGYPPCFKCGRDGHTPERCLYR